MKKRIYLIAIAGLLAFLSSCLGGKFKATTHDDGVSYRIQTENVRIRFYAENVARVTKWTKDGTSETQSLMVVQQDLPQVDFTQTEDAQTLTLSTSKMRLVISKETGAIQYQQADGTPYLQELAASFEPVEYDGDKGFSVQQTFQLSADEGIYGLGQHQYGYLNYRGKEVVLVQSNCDAVVPFLTSTQNYGILWDNYSKTVFNDQNDATSLWSDMGDNIDYYFVGGTSMDEAIAGYRQLTGQAPMYGKWAFGFWQSKEHYDTQHEIDSVATRYRQLKMPIDNIIQDWDYWNGPANWSGMFFDSILFPKPDALIARLHDMNYHMMISIWPALGPNTPIYKDMLEKGFLFDPIGWAGFRYYDAFNPAANDLYWEYLKKGLYVKGIDGWWIDSTEPDIINALKKDSHEYEMKKVGSNFLGSWARYLNGFSLAMTDALFKKMRAETDQKRVYILTRSTYAGQQRTGATTWSGDIGASWEIYKAQIAAGVNHSMSGIPYWTFDIGSFVLGSYGGVFSDGKKTPAYEELYTRMYQLGAFCPIFRSHGSDTPREIFSMNNYQDVQLKYNNLRYRLLPYIYSLSWQVTNNSYTMMRGLPMDFNADKKTYSIDDQYLFGPSLMVCPVTECMYHEPPKASVLVESNYFTTADGKPGLNAKYYNDKAFTNLTREVIDPTIDIYWYTGRPAYATDSMYSIVWSGKLTPDQSGKHQFHLKTFDQYQVFVDGVELETAFKGSEKYLIPIELEAGHSYNFEVKLSNNQTGAARMNLFWKTPDKFAAEGQPVTRSKERNVYLPVGKTWFDFWTGKTYSGGQTIATAAPIETLPLFVPAGSIIPMGPFLQYSNEKPADPIELRVYAGTNGRFTLYEDENDTYNYEKGVYATIDFEWNEAEKSLTIGARKGEFPGMLTERTFNIVLVGEKMGNGLDVAPKPTQVVKYNGNEVVARF